MTLIEGSTRVESKTSQTIIINLKFLVWKFFFKSRCWKNFFQNENKFMKKSENENKLIRSLPKLKQVYERKKQINVVLKQINVSDNTFMNHLFFVWFFFSDIKQNK
jgi:hypothetical protein